MNIFPVKQLVLGILGGLAGGAIGFFACQWLVDQSLYSVVLPGVLVGLGFAFAARKKHIAFGIISAIMGLVAGLVTEWRVYSNEPSFFKLVGELKDDSIVTWLMLGVGTVLAFSFGMGRDHLTINEPVRPNTKS